MLRCRCLLPAADDDAVAAAADDDIDDDDDDDDDDNEDRDIKIPTVRVWEQRIILLMYVDANEPSSLHCRSYF